MDGTQTSVSLAARRAWQRVLRVDEISEADDFFELGGHSIAAMRVILMLRRDLVRGLALETLLMNPQFAAFVDVVASQVDPAQVDPAKVDSARVDPAPAGDRRHGAIP